MKLARVFPRRTCATPTDELAFIGGPGLFPPTIDAVHVSVTFSWDLAEARRIAADWDRIGPTTIGGPALDDRGNDFAVGRYLKPGYVITSRGCPNHCWFCDAWKREGAIRELPICEGWNIADNNLLACSDKHVAAVFDMLRGQNRRPQFTGGFEAQRLQPWHAEALRELRPASIYFAYDTPNDWEPLRCAIHILQAAGFKKLRSPPFGCYVLIGWPGDSIASAESRLRGVGNLGLMPFAMLYRSRENRKPPPAWKRFQRIWARPAVARKLLEEGE